MPSLATTRRRLTTAMQAASAPAEIQALLLGSRIDPEAAALSRLKTLAAQGLNWPMLIRMAWAHGLLPILSRNLLSCEEAVPKEVRAQLITYGRSNTRRNLVLLAELVRITTRLRQQDIPALPFKGPVSAVFAYGDIALREFSDIDILVQPGDLSAVLRIMSAANYCKAEGFSKKLPDDRLRSGEAECLVNSATGILVEVHTCLIENRFSVPLNKDAAAAWTRLVSVDLGGTIFRTLSPEDHLLYLAAHESKHRWERLEGICCMTQIARRIACWPGLMERARALGLESQLLVGLAIGSDVLDAPLPLGLANIIADRSKIRELAAVIGQQFVREPQDHFDRVDASLRAFRVRDHWQDRWRLIGFAPNERDRAFLRLPSSLEFAYPFIRPLRLCVEYGILSCRRLAARIRRPRNLMKSCRATAICDAPRNR